MKKKVLLEKYSRNKFKLQSIITNISISLSHHSQISLYDNYKLPEYTDINSFNKIA